MINPKKEMAEFQKGRKQGVIMMIAYSFVIVFTFPLVLALLLFGRNSLNDEKDFDVCEGA